MKGLLIKDFYMLLKYARIFLAMVVLFLGITAFGDESGSFMLAYPLLMASILSVSLLSYDEKFHWDSYCLTTPVSRGVIVTEKYLLTLILTGTVFILTALLQLRLALTDAMTAAEYFAMLDSLLIMAVAAPAIMLPVIFKLGMEKGRLAYYIVFGLVFLGVMTVPDMLDGRKLAFTSSPLVSLLILAFCAVVYFISWRLSIRFYKSREF